MKFQVRQPNYTRFTIWSEGGGEDVEVVKVRVWK